MRLAIVHYHLRKGGVTKVIASALEALGETAGQTVVLSSTEPEEPLPCDCVVIPELAYNEAPSMHSVDRLHQLLLESASLSLGGPPDLWHIHNHCLGKNVNFPPVLKRLLDDGARALLQIHDFSEDGRPGNYTAQLKPFLDGTFADINTTLYPVAPQVGYAVLNGRDRRILEVAGVPKEQVFWLPNAVTVPELNENEHSADSSQALILYPTRAIRRKNIGELLLHALAFPQYRFGTTLSPKNPLWANIYEGWTQLAGELPVSVEFGMGERPGKSFANLISEATAIVTTSVGEGFGLAFLEPWLFGKPLYGRDLPEVTQDFKDNGIRLPNVYERWPVSCQLFNGNNLRGRYQESVKAFYLAYGKSIEESELDSTWERMTANGMIDFGSLDEIAQAEVLRSVAISPGKLEPPTNSSPDQLNKGVLPDNVRHIEAAYGLSPYGENLASIYSSILDASPAPVRGINPQRILSQFLDLDRFNLLRT